MQKKTLLSVALIFATFLLLLVGGVLLDKSSSAYAAKEDRFKDFDTFSKALNIIETNYVDNLTDKELMHGAIKGMLLELDPHSAFFAPDVFKSFMTDMKGEFGGLGMTVGMRDEAVVVIAPIEDTPAFKAGLKAGDIIIMIDNESTAGMDTEQAVSKMRGKPGTKVTLTIVRKGEEKPLVFELVRAIIKIKSVKYEMLDNEIGYIRLTQFQENSGDEVKKAMQELDKKKAKGIILDLRNNPGGSLAEAISVSSLFLPAKKTVVTTKGRNKAADNDYVTSALTYKDLDRPLVILVNEGSASASEIVAGAIQDYNRGIVVGTTTFGKASVQSIIELGDGSAMKLTTARYYTPSGRSIQGVGIVPNMVVQQGKIVYDERTMPVLKEKDLARHLQGEMENKSVTTDNKSSIVDVNNDLQLQFGAQLLKGLMLYGKNGK